MASFFQPKDAKGTETATPSPAAQASAKFKADLLGKLLEAAGTNRRPSFADFTRGAKIPSSLPPGMGAGIGDLLMAMSQPGAFTSTKTATGRGVTPSMFSDLAQLGILGATLYNSKLGQDAIGGILGMIGGAQGINGVNTALGDFSADEAAASQDSALADYFFNADPTSGGANSYGVNVSDQGSGADIDPYVLSLLGLV